MLPGEFLRKLQKLNKNLRVYCGDDSTKPAGLWMYDKNGEQMLICGVDKNEVPRFSVYNEKGRMIKGGWVRGVKILVDLKLADLHRSREVFGPWDSWKRPEVQHQTSATDREIASVTRKGYWKKDELVDIGREINKARPSTVQAPTAGRIL